MHRALPVAVAVLVLLSGCSALAPGSSTDTPASATDDPAPATDTSTAATTTAATITPMTTPTATSPPTATTATATPSATDTTAAALPSTATPTGTAPATNEGSVTSPMEAATTRTATDAGNESARASLPPVEEVTADAIAAIEAVETYRVRTNQTVEVAAGITQTTRATTNAAFDRSAREFRANVTQSAMGRTASLDRYFVNDTLYINSQQYVREYDSAWVKQSFPTGGGAAWSALDTLARQRALLDNGSARLAGTERVAGTEAYVLRVDAPLSQFGGPGASVAQRESFSINDSTATFWIDTETLRPIRTAVEFTGEATIRGRTVGYTQTIESRYTGYGEPVTVELPPEADTAVPIESSVGNASAPEADSTRASG